MVNFNAHEQAHARIKAIGTAAYSSVALADIFI